MTNKEKDQVVWRPYPDYPFIEANQFGEIRTKDRYISCKNGVKRFVKGHSLKQYLNPNGYLYIDFSVNGKRVHLRVNRVVAVCFLPNPDNLPEVNHIDCDRTNNAVSNLEWCSREYNIQHREKHGIALKRPVFAANLKTSKVSYFESQSEASRQLGVNDGSINNVVKGRLNQAGGYLFTENKSEITKEKIQEVRNSVHFWGEVIAIDLKTLEIFHFESQSEAARQLDIDSRRISDCINDRRRQVYDFWFCDVDENAIEKTRSKFGDDVASKVEELMNDN